MACTTRATSTTPAASPSWHGCARPLRTRSSPGRCARSSASSTAEPRAPTPTPGTAPASCSSSPTPSCAPRPASSCPRRAATAWPLCFLPSGNPAEAMRLLEDRVEAEGQRVLGWREVPVNEAACGAASRAVAPRIAQLFVGAGDDARPGRLRAQALRDPPRRRARGPRGARHPELLQPHHGPQGHAHRAPAAALLPGPARRARGEPPGARALALLHEHLPELGARPPVPHARPQRRDQHPARQPQLDARARAPARLAACSATTSRRSTRCCATTSPTRPRSTA